MSGTPKRVPPVPAVLRLVQMAVQGKWRATGEDLYREVARLTEAVPGKEIIVSGCGDGITTEWLALRTGAAVTGVDADAESIDIAEARARAHPTPLPITYQHAPLDDLPHEDEVFDIAVGEPALSAADDPERAIRELVRVTRPMGPIVLLQPTWSSEISPEARELVVERLGLRPFLLVEWKQMLRDAGVVDVQVQDWTSGAPGSGARATGAAPAQAPLLTWRQKAHIMGRAWRWWGWREARGAVERETALLRALSRERSIGFQLMRGVKWPYAKES
ncbi:MAG TPA: class I SAM-dependent methyltransferase [Gemmatimonadaceae bacterium]|nr:class I SAM-dependent methyltransferase [Gemmatimonadaceae bacterium]